MHLNDLKLVLNIPPDPNHTAHSWFPNHMWQHMLCTGLQNTTVLGHRRK